MTRSGDDKSRLNSRVLPSGCCKSCARFTARHLTRKHSEGQCFLAKCQAHLQVLQCFVEIEARRVNLLQARKADSSLPAACVFSRTRLAAEGRNRRLSRRENAWRISASASSSASSGVPGGRRGSARLRNQ
jgi:hypothetical protein